MVTEVQIIHSEVPSLANTGNHIIRNNSKVSMTSTGSQERKRFEGRSQTSPAHSESHFFSSVVSNNQTAPAKPPIASRVMTSICSIASKFVVDDPIKRAYLRTSFLFAISVLVTWIPSSLNRINSWLHGQSPFEFHVATAAVLPLQGLWNAIIFFVTSWATVRRNSIATKVIGNRDVTEHHRMEALPAKSRSSHGQDSWPGRA